MPSRTADRQRIHRRRIERQDGDIALIGQVGDSVDRGHWLSLRQGSSGFGAHGFSPDVSGSLEPADPVFENASPLTDRRVAKERHLRLLGSIPKTFGGDFCETFTRLLLALADRFHAYATGAVMAAPPAYLVRRRRRSGLVPAVETALDADRKPAETLAIAGVKPGSTVVDLLAGRWLFHPHHLGRRLAPKGPCLCR